MLGRTEKNKIINKPKKKVGMDEPRKSVSSGEEAAARARTAN